LQFDLAVSNFQDFLTSKGYPAKVTWITPMDILFTNGPTIYVKMPVSELNERDARLACETTSANERGIVFHALGSSDNSTFAYAWRPKNLDEAHRNLIGLGLKLSAATCESRIPFAEVRNDWHWDILRFRYRKFQVNDVSLFPS
jgi:hypothetical protein